MDNISVSTKPQMAALIEPAIKRTLTETIGNSSCLKTHAILEKQSELILAMKNHQLQAGLSKEAIKQSVLLMSY